MKTIKIDENYIGVVPFLNGYKLEGDLFFQNAIVEIVIDLFCTGSIAGKSIRAEGSIEA